MAEGVVVTIHDREIAWIGIKTQLEVNELMHMYATNPAFNEFVENMVEVMAAHIAFTHTPPESRSQ